jgi:phosphatidylserine/phosphatidylglycerophosphate/cardiolipin synthase-like enzyme
MQYLKRNTKHSILAFLIIVLSITISISILAKTEVYFSLSDNPQKAIIKNINQAEAFINIAMYTFTDKEIAITLAKAQTLLTGSYNWTFSANNRNDENLMAIDDPEIIEIFQNQFVNLWTNKYNPERTKELFNKAKVNILTVFPPPVQTGTKVININSAS